MKALSIGTFANLKNPKILSIFYLKKFTAKTIASHVLNLTVLYNFFKLFLPEYCYKSVRVFLSTISVELALYYTCSLET